MRQKEEDRSRPASGAQPGVAAPPEGNPAVASVQPNAAPPPGRGRSRARVSGRPAMITRETECEIAYAVRSLGKTQRETASYFYLKSHREIGRILANPLLIEQPFEWGPGHQQILRSRYAAALGKSVAALLPEGEAAPDLRVIRPEEDRT